ncbi:MAG: hypothetical protein JSU63_04150 [Phycisphaerales bacterium]|nr:MAG: hypothetical protein JSU63_04150 [Phycisphaerales bacterium]
MPEANLLTICATAFVAVFVILALQALAIRLITLIFPQRERAVDAVMAAAICSTVATLYPGARVTEIEEET